VTGASGLVGQALCATLVREGVPFCVLSREPERAQRHVPGARSYHRWEPIERGRAWTDVVEGARAIVHLASPLVAAGRWSDARRQELYDACVMGTRGVVSSLAQARTRPQVLVCASSVAYYAFDAGGAFESPEDGAAGDDFLSRLTADWEAEAMHAEQFGVRTVVLRTALVLARSGAVPRLRRAARLGMGGPPSPGTQRQPWIHLVDEIGLLLLALSDDRVTGALNCVAPQRVTSAEFMETLAAMAGTAAGMAPPDWLLHSRFGAGAIVVTQGRGAVPARALALGYEFRQPRLDRALQASLAA
jgi:uncharacterized protein